MHPPAELLAAPPFVPSDSLGVHCGLFLSAQPLAVQDKIRWNANYLPHIPYMKTRRGASSQWINRAGSVNVFQYTARAPNYIGYDWNACAGTTIDCRSSNNNNWGDYNDGPISHRAMLYWEPGDTGCEFPGMSSAAAWACS